MCQTKTELNDSSVSPYFIIYHSANRIFFEERFEKKLWLILIWGEYSESNSGSPLLHTLSHKLAHKVENVSNPMQSYDIWSVA